MDDRALIHAFEAGEEPLGGFHHAQHVRVAWCYLREHAFGEALTRFSSGLRAFAVARGKPGLYHETITVAFMLIISERLADAGGVPWDEFAARNPDVLRWKPSVLERYYRPETLGSARARAHFVMPDRLADQDHEG